MAKTDKDQNQATTTLAPSKSMVNESGKITTPGAAVQISEDGRTTIYPQVVGKIAGIAVREIEGVHRLVPYGAGQQVASFAKSVTGSEMRDLGVHVEVGTKEAAIDVRIITSYGASIPAVSEAIRRNVADRIGTMTGLNVVEVNVDVIDLYFEEDEADIEEQPSRRVQ